MLKLVLHDTCEMHINDILNYDKFTFIRILDIDIIGSKNNYYICLSKKIDEPNYCLLIYNYNNESQACILNIIINLSMHVCQS